jgi:aspartyl/glutamyl-tRNA(Asn/Gln) amidotransferase C subunit
MSEPITIEIFNHLVDLASLDLDPDAAEYLRSQLNRQLASIRELEAVPLDADVPISLHGVPYSPEVSASPREDEWVPYPGTEDILSQAPQVEDRYIVVPDIPHTTLK